MDEEASTPEEHPELAEVMEGALVASRAEEAYQLKLRGLPLSEIADTLGFANDGEVCHAINAMLKGQAQFVSSVGRNGFLQIELDRLEALQAKLWPSAMQADLQSVDRILKIMDRRAKYLGLDSIDTATQQHTVLVLGEQEGDYIERLKELSQ